MVQASLVEILFLPLISSSSLKLLGVCAGSVPENELCELELCLGPERGGEPRAPAPCSFNSKNFVPFLR